MNFSCDVISKIAIILICSVLNNIDKNIKKPKHGTCGGLDPLDLPHKIDIACDDKMFFYDFGYINYTLLFVNKKKDTK